MGESDEGVSQAARILSEEAVPTITVMEDEQAGSSGSVRLSVEKSQESSHVQVKPYVAISHVWSDGLGNPHNNSLPQCQLKRIQTLVNDLYQECDGPVPFWIDTICVPLQKDSRKQAIRRMGQTYRDSDKVLVLDSWLLRSTLPDYRELGLLRIKCCTWAQRLWTLQEGMIAAVEGVYFQTATGPINEEDMYDATCCTMYDLVKGLIGTEEDPLSEEHSDLTHHILEATDRLIEIDGVRYTSLGRGDEKTPANRLVQRVKGWTEFNDVFVEGRSYLQGLRWPLRVARNRHTDNEILETNELMFIGHGMKDRATSKPEDEPVCLATLLGFDVRDLLDVDDVGERMKMVLSRLHIVSKDLLFSHAKQIDQDGYRWAPISFMMSRKEYGPPTLLSPSSTATVTPEGLRVRLYGLVLEKFPFASPNFLVDIGHVLLRIRVPETSATPRQPELTHDHYRFSVILEINDRPQISMGRLNGALVHLKDDGGDEIMAEFVGNVHVNSVRPEHANGGDLRVDCRVIHNHMWCIR